MPTMHKIFAIAAFLLLGGLTLPAPAGATVIDIDAADPSSVVILDLGRGDYIVETIGRAGGGAYDAWNPWGYVDGCDAFGMNCSKGWFTGFSISSPSIGFLKINHEPVANRTLFATPELALINAAPFRFWLDSTESVTFSIFDPIKKDNEGGVSLRLTQVPEPAGLALLVAGLLGVSAFRLRNVRKASQGVRITRG